MFAIYNNKLSSVLANMSTFEPDKENLRGSLLFLFIWEKLPRSMATMPMSHTRCRALFQQLKNGNFKSPASSAKIYPKGGLLRTVETWWNDQYSTLPISNLWIKSWIAILKKTKYADRHVQKCSSMTSCCEFWTYSIYFNLSPYYSSSNHEEYIGEDLSVIYFCLNEERKLAES